MQETDRVAGALAAASVAAERGGLRFDRAVLLRDFSNVLVHLEGAGVVARVAGLTAAVRHGDAWLAREVAVAGFLARAGAPVVAPARAIDPGPHCVDGRWLSFWEYVESDPAALDPAAAGRALRRCHEVLEDFEGGGLVAYQALDEAVGIHRRAIERGWHGADDAALLARLCEELPRALREARFPLRPVHGDAHLRNVFATAAGPLWSDWEDSFLGPVVWDLACLLHSARTVGEPGEVAAAEAALAAHGASVEPEQLELCLDARVFQVLAWVSVFGPAQPSLRASEAQRLAWLRARRG